MQGVHEPLLDEGESEVAQQAEEAAGATTEQLADGAGAGGEGAWDDLDAAHAAEEAAARRAYRTQLYGLFLYAVSACCSCCPQLLWWLGRRGGGSAASGPCQWGARMQGSLWGSPSRCVGMACSAHTCGDSLSCACRCQLFSARG